MPTTWAPGCAALIASSSVPGSAAHVKHAFARSDAHLPDQALAELVHTQQAQDGIVEGTEEPELEESAKLCGATCG